MNNELTQQQIDSIEAMIARRMDNTDETRAETCEHIANYFKSALSKDD